MQIAVMDIQRFKRLDRGHDVFRVGPGVSVTCPHETQLFVERQTAGILRMAAIDTTHQRADAPCAAVHQIDLPVSLEIDTGDLFALAQIIDSGFALAGGDAECDTTARPATVEAHHEAGAFGRPAM